MYCLGNKKEIESRYTNISYKLIAICVQYVLFHSHHCCGFTLLNAYNHMLFCLLLVLPYIFRKYKMAIAFVSIFTKSKP